MSHSKNVLIALILADKVFCLIVLFGLGTLALYLSGAGNTESGKPLLEGSACFTGLLVLLRVL